MKWLVVTLCFLSAGSKANAARAVMEGIAATNSVIYVDTVNSRVAFGTNGCSIYSTGTITCIGNPAYTLSSSADFQYGVYAATLAVSASTGSYELEFQGFTTTGTATAVVIRFGNVSTTADTATNYNASDNYSDSGGSASSDSGAGVTGCYFHRTTTTLTNNRLHKGKFFLDLNGTEAAMVGETLVNSSGVATRTHTGCNYLGPSVVNFVFIHPTTAGGQIKGHVELRRTK